MNHIVIGVDTHKASHIAVAIDANGSRLGSTTIPTTRDGYRALEAWASRFGQVKAFGIEGHVHYGATKTSFHPGTGAKKVVATPEKAIVAEVPELRIISRPLWEAAQAQLDATRAQGE